MDLYSSVRLTDHECQIRLLDLHPGSFGSGLSGTLRVASTAETTYEALSYTWGVAAPKHSIRLNGLHSLPLTPNLHAALKRLRTRNGKRTLWIDGICINQADIPEKTAQVGVMSLIYSSAVCVNVWLGEYDVTLSNRILLAYLHVKDLAYYYASWRPRDVLDTSRAKDRVDYLSESLKDHFGTRRPLERDMLYNLGNTKSRGVLDSEIASLNRALLSAEVLWHTRLWVVQEYVLARRVFFCWGPWRKEWDDQRVTFALSLHQLISRCEELGFYAARAFFEDLGGRLSYFRRSIRDHHSLELLEGLTNCVARSCGDPRDRVFALLGLVNPQASSQISADYGKPYQEVYARTTFTLLKVRDSFDTICYKLPNPCHTDGIPSWAADFSDTGVLHSLAEIPKGLHYHPGSQIVRNAKLDDTGKTLILRDMTYELVYAVHEVSNHPSRSSLDTLVSTSTLPSSLAVGTSAMQVTAGEEPNQSKRPIKQNKWLDERLETLLKGWERLAARTRESEGAFSNETGPSVAFVGHLGTVGFARKGVKPNDELVETDVSGRDLVLRPVQDSEKTKIYTEHILVGGADTYRPVARLHSSMIGRGKRTKSFTIV